MKTTSLWGIQKHKCVILKLTVMILATSLAVGIFLSRFSPQISLFQKSIVPEPVKNEVRIKDWVYNDEDHESLARIRAFLAIPEAERTWSAEIRAQIPWESEGLDIKPLRTVVPERPETSSSGVHIGTSAHKRSALLQLRQRQVAREASAAVKSPAKSFVKPPVIPTAPPAEPSSKKPKISSEPDLLSIPAVLSPEAIGAGAALIDSYGDSLAQHSGDLRSRDLAMYSVHVLREALGCAMMHGFNVKKLEADLAEAKHVADGQTKLIQEYMEYLEEEKRICARLRHEIVGLQAAKAKQDKDMEMLEKMAVDDIHYYNALGRIQLARELRNDEVLAAESQSFMDQFPGMDLPDPAAPVPPSPATPSEKSGC